MERPTCATCPYWGDYEEFKRSEVGEEDFSVCMRFPPVIFESEGFEAFWPEVYATASCGEHPDFPRYIEESRRTQP